MNQMVTRLPAQDRLSKTLINREWEGKTFLFREDGYFNMTKAAQSFGKEVQDFFKLSTVKEYIEEMERVVWEKSPTLELVQAIGGNRYMPERGTWGHPKIAVFFARWLSPKFSVFCDMVIDDILTNKAELIITQPEISATVAVAEQFKIPGDFAEALRLAADAWEGKQVAEAQTKLALEQKAVVEAEKEVLQEELEEAAPKVEAWDRFQNSEGLWTRRDAAGKLEVEERSWFSKSLQTAQAIGQRIRQPGNLLKNRAVKEIPVWQS